MRNGRTDSNSWYAPVLLCCAVSLLYCALQGASAAAESKGRKLSARQRKQRNYAALGYGSDDEYGYRYGWRPS